MGAPSRATAPDGVASLRPAMGRVRQGDAFALPARVHYATARPRPLSGEGALGGKPGWQRIDLPPLKVPLAPSKTVSDSSRDALWDGVSPGDTRSGLNLPQDRNETRPTLLHTALPFSTAKRRPSSTEIRGNDWAFLRESSPPHLTLPSADCVRVVDLFCGAGGLTLGAAEACTSVGRNIDVRFAADFEQSAINCYRANFPDATAECVDLREIFSENLSDALSAAEKRLRKKTGPVDLLLGGPPCQGHSDLNNYSRRNDPKNHLYKIMGRAAKVLKPDHVLIENVPGAIHDQSGSVAFTLRQLKELGYSIDVATVSAVELGVPQLRKRLVVIASRTKNPCVADVVAKYRTPERSIAWAIEDIQDEASLDLTSTPAASNPTTRARIDYLFDNSLYELPDAQRPACHRDKSHSYKSVYGRMAWDKPAQTITSGFYSMCMGRYVHPSRRRTLTAHEAARLQFFPDYFDFRSAGSRTALAKILGNAVPPKFAYPFVREILT